MLKEMGKVAGFSYENDQNRNSFQVYKKTLLDEQYKQVT